MDGVLVAQDMQGFIVAALFDVAVGGEIFARRVTSYQILSCEETEGAGVVCGGEMDLGEPKGVLVVVCESRIRRGGGGLE